MLVSVSSVLLLVGAVLHPRQGPPVVAPGANPEQQVPDEDLLPRRTFEQRLAAHRHFSKLAFERVESHPPYVFLVQKTGADDPARAKRSVELYVGLLDPVLERFEQEVVVPLGLVQRDDRARFTLVLLASRGDFDNYASVTGASPHLNADTFYDRGLNAVVLFEDVFVGPRTPDGRARSARHGLVHACQQAWVAGGQNAALDSWLLEGMADAWARQAGATGGATIDSEWLRAFARDAQARGAEGEARRWVRLRTLQEFDTVIDPSRLAGFLRTHTPKDAPEFDPGGSWWSFYRQSSLVFQFLSEAGEGRHRSLLTALLREALAGRGTPGSAPAGLPDTLDGEFLAWVRAAHAAALPAETLDAGLFDKALVRGPLGTPVFSVASASPAAAGSTPAPAHTPPLDLADATAEERLARALHELGHGSASRALPALEALEQDTLAAAPRELARRELRRARAWIAVRDAYLAALVASGKPLDFTVGGRAHKAKVLALAQGRLQLEQNRSGRASLALDELDALALAQAIKPAGGPDDWARLLPYVLRGDGRARKLLAEDGGEASALLRDAREDYPARLRLGAAAARIEELAARPVPATPDETRTQLDELVALKAEHGELALVQRKSDALRGRARALLARQIELLGPSSLLAGKLEVLADDNVRISYAFDDARELADFSAANYPALARKALGVESTEDVPFHLEEGQLSATGQASLRTLVDLGAPLSVRYSVEYVYRDETQGTAMAVGLCDDGREHFVWALNSEHLQRYEAGGNDHAHGPGATFFMNTPYAMELVHDGARVKFLCEGTEQRSLAAGGRQSGAVFLCTQSNQPIRLARLEIEGKLLSNSFERLAQAWVERELERY
mgnify:CR=1 FL=1